MALKCDVSEANIKIMAQGTLKDMVSDVMSIVSSLYSDLLDSDKIQADFFKYAMTRAVIDANSPLWVPRKKDEGDLAIHIPLSPDGLFNTKEQ